MRIRESASDADNAGDAIEMDGPLRRTTSRYCSDGSDDGVRREAHVATRSVGASRCRPATVRGDMASISTLRAGLVLGAAARRRQTASRSAKLPRHQPCLASPPSQDHRAATCAARRQPVRASDFVWAAATDYVAASPWLLRRCTTTGRRSLGVRERACREPGLHERAPKRAPRRGADDRGVGSRTRGRCAPR